jgi:hypothetical protein
LHGSEAASPRDMFRLQQTIGNQAVQRLVASNTRSAVVQPKRVPAHPASPQEHTAGLSDRLKAGVEKLSGLSLDDVQVL